MTKKADFKQRVRARVAKTGESYATARMHPHMLRHTFVTTMLDAGVDLRDVQTAARHADPRTTMRYDRARQNLDRHPNYILAAYMSAGPDLLARSCRRERVRSWGMRSGRSAPSRRQWASAFARERLPVPSSPQGT